MHVTNELVAIKRAIEPYERQKAKERQLNANTSGTKLDPSVNFSEGGNALEKIAGFVKVDPHFRR